MLSNFLFWLVDNNIFGFGNYCYALTGLNQLRRCYNHKPTCDWCGRFSENKDTSLKANKGLIMREVK